MVNVGKFIPYVDPMGSVILIGSYRNPYNGLFSLALLKSPMPGVIMGHLNDWDSLRRSSSLPGRWRSGLQTTQEQSCQTLVSSADVRSIYLYSVYEGFQ